MSNTLSTTGLTVGYASGKKVKRVLCDIDVELRSGEVVVLLGANGVGKSTLLRTLAGVQRPLVGTVMLGDHDLEWMSLNEISRSISLVYTDRVAAGGLTVEEIVGLGRYPYTGFLGLLSEDDRVAVHRAMEAVGIAHKALDNASALSDGERQKVMIARALAQDTPIIILDEPTSFLDVPSRLEVMKLLRSLATEHGRSVLLSTHDVAPALDIADRLWLALPERLTVVQGPRDEMLSSRHIANLFPGHRLRFSPEIRDFILD